MYGVALVSRIDKIIGLFCKRALQKRQYSAKETYNFIDPTDRNHPICIYVCRKGMPGSISELLYNVLINIPYLYICIYLNIYVNICIHIYTCMHLCVYIYVYIHAYIHIHTYIYVYVHTYVHTWKNCMHSPLPSTHAHIFVNT